MCSANCFIIFQFSGWTTNIVDIVLAHHFGHVSNLQAAELTTLGKVWALRFVLNCPSDPEISLHQIRVATDIAMFSAGQLCSQEFSPLAASMHVQSSALPCPLTPFSASGKVVKCERVSSLLLES